MLKENSITISKEYLSRSILFESSNEAHLIAGKLQHFLDQFSNVNSESKFIFSFNSLSLPCLVINLTFLISAKTRPLSVLVV